MIYAENSFCIAFLAIFFRPVIDCRKYRKSEKFIDFRHVGTLNGSIDTQTIWHKIRHQNITPHVLFSDRVLPLALQELSKF